MPARDRPSATVAPQVVARTELLGRMASLAEGSIVLVSAPAGSGKSVLLRSWVDRAGLEERTAWVTVERD